MFPYEFYQFLHFVSLFALLMVFGAAWASLSLPEAVMSSWRKRLAMIHGISLFVLFVAGFGMITRLRIPMAEAPLWVWLKIVAWVMLGLALPLIKRRKLNGARLFAFVGFWFVFAFAAVVWKF